MKTKLKIFAKCCLCIIIGINFNSSYDMDGDKCLSPDLNDLEKLEITGGNI